MGATAPTACWALNVTTLDAADIANSGSFSRKSDPNFEFWIGSRPSTQNRLSGHTSSSNKTNGSVTNIGLLNKLNAKKHATNPYRINDGEPTYLAYAHTAHRPKNVLNKSLRSAIHATDSTCSGCTANSAATNALRHALPVMVRRTTNNNAVFAPWSSAFSRWCHPGREPKI